MIIRIISYVLIEFILLITLRFCQCFNKFFLLPKLLMVVPLLVVWHVQTNDGPVHMIVEIVGDNEGKRTNIRLHVLHACVCLSLLCICRIDHTDRIRNLKVNHWINKKLIFFFTRLFNELELIWLFQKTIRTLRCMGFEVMRSWWFWCEEFFEAYRTGVFSIRFSSCMYFCR